MMPVDLDPATGAPLPDATPDMRAAGAAVPIGPAHVLGAVLESLGADPARLREPPLTPLLRA
jgi:hypothetical protein